MCPFEKSRNMWYRDVRLSACKPFFINKMVIHRYLFTSDFDHLLYNAFYGMPHQTYVWMCKCNPRVHREKNHLNFTKNEEHETLARKFRLFMNFEIADGSDPIL